MLYRINRSLSPLWRSFRGRSHRGFCPICERSVEFESEGPWLRDQYKCRECHSIPRWRTLMTVIAESYPNWRELQIHESSPGGPLSNKLASECQGYLPSHFFPEATRGEIFKGYRCEDLMDQTFPNEAFDLVVTSDVFEHLPSVEPACQEIMRTLKPGGAHIFTVPWFKNRKTLVRAVVENGELRHIEEPDYHGNPIDDSGSLVFTEWGKELPFLLNRWGQCPVVIHTIRDRSLGIDGDFREVFVQQKPAN